MAKAPANRVKEITEHLHNEAVVHKAPSIYNTPFLQLEGIGVVEPENQIMLKAGDGQEVMGFTLDYGDGEYYQIFVWGGKRA